MHTSRLYLTLSMLACCALAHAAKKDHPADATVLLATADPSVSPIHVAAAAIEARPESAGIADGLPEMPEVAAAFSVNVLLHPALRRPEPSRLSMATVRLPDAPGVSLLEASPLAGMARRMGAQKFNTDDGSDVDAFAICYRLSKRASLQVIPGDPAPVKIPVTTMANNMGVTVGMVVRLSRSR